MTDAIYTPALEEILRGTLDIIGPNNEGSLRAALVSDYVFNHEHSEVGTNGVTPVDHGTFPHKQVTGLDWTRVNSRIYLIADSLTWTESVPNNATGVVLYFGGRYGETSVGDRNPIPVVYKSEGFPSSLTGNLSVNWREITLADGKTKKSSIFYISGS